MNQQEIITRINQLIKDKYVFPAITKELVNQLEDKLATGHYAQISSQSEFAESLTTELHHISGDQHLMVVYDPKRIRAMQRAATPIEARIEQERQLNFGFHKVERLKGNVGYLDLRRFADPKYAGETAAAAMRFLAESDAVIIDLRHNGGGNPNMVQFLCSYFFESDRPIHLNSIYSRSADTTWEYWTLPFVPGKRLSDVDLYILTSGHTFSGAEEFAYNMSALERATVIGESTAGGANPAGIEIIDDEFYITVPHGTPTNPLTGDNWEAKGVEPHLKVDHERALETAHLKALEAFIAKDPDSTLLPWLLDEVRTQYQPISISKEKQEDLSGQYGDHAIHLRTGNLYFQRRFVLYRMCPLSEIKFWLDGPDMLQPYRIEIDDGKLNALYPDGGRIRMGQKD